MAVTGMEVNKINQALEPGFYAFLDALDVFQFTDWRRTLLTTRDSGLKLSQTSYVGKPTFSREKLPAWRADLPDWLQDQRNQMTGPASDDALCVKMINSRSPGVMLDLEDSCANTPENIINGHENVKSALYRSLAYRKSPKQIIACDPQSPSVVFTRVRGLHVGQILTRDGVDKDYGASLFDVAYHFYDMDLEHLAHPPCLYIPKSEYANEATWWNTLLRTVENLKGWPRGAIKVMALVESHPLAYELEHFMFGLRERLVGLNLGRWDYMASLIDYNYHDPEWLFPDRNSIPGDVAFFQNLRYRMAQLCHQHGVLAIGGMTALYPSRTDKELNKRALMVLHKDKTNEANCFMDGAWTGHPDQNDIAVSAFPAPNQLEKLPGEQWLDVDLRSFPENKDLAITEEGTREAIRTCIQYRQAVLEGKGAKLINGYMEDLATDRIYRIMIAQRLDFGIHTLEELQEMFNEELNTLGVEFDAGARATLQLVMDRQFNPR